MTPFICDYCGKSHDSVQEYQSCKNISSEIGSMFNDLSGSYEDTYSSAYIQMLFNEAEYLKEGYVPIHFEEKLDTQDDEYFYLIAYLYGKSLVDCPRCLSYGKMQRTTGRKSIQCRKCRHQMYPLANTIFQKSTTPLKTWFRVMIRMAIDKVTIMDISKNFDLGYKTAHRMYHKIYNAPFYNKLSDVKNTLHYQVIKDDVDKRIFSVNSKEFVKIGRLKLTDSDISKIRGRYDNGESCKSIAIDFKIDYSYCIKICKEKHRVIYKKELVNSTKRQPLKVIELSQLESIMT